MSARNFNSWLRSLGAPEDAVATDTSSAWSAMSLLKAIYGGLQSGAFITARIADQATAEAGSDNEDLMTPLRTKQQINARLATQANAEAGIDNVALMTALRTAQAIDAQVPVIEKDIPSDQTVKMPAPQTIRAWDYRWPIFAFAGGATERAKATNIADFQSAITTALSSGERVWFPKWDYPIRSLGNSNAGVGGGKAGVYVDDEVHVDVECDVGARFVTGDIVHTAGVPEEVDVFQFYSNINPSLDNTDVKRFSWRGGHFDARDITDAHGAGSLTGPTFMRLYKRWSPSVSKAVFDSGYTAFQASGDSGDRAGAGFMDQGISSHQCINEVYKENVFIGLFDLGVYINGVSSTGEGYEDGPLGEAAQVIGNYFRRCGSAANVKRCHRGSIIAYNFIFECSTGILESPGGVTAGDGKRSKIIGNTLYRVVTHPIIVTGGEGDIVAFNEIINFGHSLHDDGVSVDSVSAGQDRGAITVASTTNTKVIGNTIKQEGNWAVDTDTTNPVTGIVLKRDTDYVGGATLAIVKDNTIENCVRPIKEFVDCSSNQICDNLVSTSNPSSVASDLLGTTPIVDTIDIASAFVQFVDNGDYILRLKLPEAVTITETTSKCTSGTATATFKINTTALGGSTNSVSSSEQSRTHSSNNVAAANDDIVVTISSASSCVGMALTVKGTRRRPQS